MPVFVAPMHYVTVEFRLLGENVEDRAIEVGGEHRFLYGVEQWIEGVDQKLENLGEGELLELILDSEASAHVASHLLQENKVEKQLVLELRVVQVVKAKPREVVKALAAAVKCCDHCGSY